MRAIFNSWDTKYKQPFGATQANTSVKWAVEVDEEIQEIEGISRTETFISLEMEFKRQVPIK